MNMEKMKKVFSDEAFVKALFEMESVAEMQEALNNKGVQLSEEEVAGIRTLFAKVKSGEISREQLEKWSVQAENGELSEEALEQVAGGGVLLCVLGGALAVALIASIVDQAIYNSKLEKTKKERGLY